MANIIIGRVNSITQDRAQQLCGRLYMYIPMLAKPRKKFAYNLDIIKITKEFANPWLSKSIEGRNGSMTTSLRPPPVAASPRSFIQPSRGGGKVKALSVGGRNTRFKLDKHVSGQWERVGQCSSESGYASTPRDYS